MIVINGVVSSLIEYMGEQIIKETQARAFEKAKMILVNHQCTLVGNLEKRIREENLPEYK